MRRSILVLIAVSTVGTLSGCVSTGGGGGGAAERFGKTFYLDGAGNWGFGSSEVSVGIRQAGYRGDVEIFVWTMTFNPLADQLNIVGARVRAAALADRIANYHRRYPENDINVIALSAGTGVATWAIENLPPGVNIKHFVLLGSSLSHDYDMSRAFKHISGTIYTYYSPHDNVLGAVRVIGTIDQKRGGDSIGLVGLKPPPGYEDRVVNTGWSRRWLRLGWAGAHTDCTNQLFVRREIGPRLLPQQTPSPPADDTSARPVTAVSH